MTTFSSGELVAQERTGTQRRKFGIMAGNVSEETAPAGANPA